jgi:hypothetical protein
VVSNPHNRKNGRISRAADRQLEFLELVERFRRYERITGSYPDPAGELAGSRRVFGVPPGKFLSLYRSGQGRPAAPG